MDPGTDFILLVGGLVFLLFFVLILFALKKALKLAFRLIVNSVLGFAGIFLLGAVGINVPITLPTIIVVALFGLAGLGTILILMFFGIKV